MEKQELAACIERIEYNSVEISRALDGCLLLEEQVKAFLKEIDISKGDADSFHGGAPKKAVADDDRVLYLNECLTKLMATLDLAWIALAHARKHNGFILEGVTEIQTDGFRNLSIVTGAKA